MLLNAIGEGIEVHSVDRDRYRDAVALLRRQHAERVEQDLSETAS